MKKIQIFILPAILVFLLLLTSSIYFFSSKQQATESLSIDQQTFIDEIADEAKKLQKESHLFASITIAQAILKSDWGRSDLAQFIRY